MQWRLDRALNVKFVFDDTKSIIKILVYIDKRDWFSYLSGLHNGQNATIFSLMKSQLLYCLPPTNDVAFDKVDTLWLWSLGYFRHKMPNGEDWFFELKFRTLILLSWVEKWKVTIHCYYLLRFFYLFKGNVPYIKTHNILLEFSLERIPLIFL